MNGSELNIVFLAGRFEIEQTQVFEHVPFDVPEGISQLRIQISYNDRISPDPNVFGGNVLDIGVFDARGTESGGEGFRGWSGSNKLDLIIGEDWATPPYRPAPLLPGMWHLLLGPYKVGPNGLEWSARIEFDPDPRALNTFVAPAVSLPEPPDDLPAALPGWYRGDLHAHTVLSDGRAYPAQVAAAACAAGLDFYGITDHNRAQSPVGMVPMGSDWPVFVPGVEVTTYAGHFNVWGTDRWYDFREPTAKGLQRAVDEAVADGGFVSINHPKPFGPPWENPEVTGFAGLEVWNGWWNKLNSVSTRVWDERLRKGERLTPLGGSDMHRLYGPTTDDNPFVPAVLGYPTTWIRTTSTLTADSILQALRNGEVFISESPSGPKLEFDVSSTGRVAVAVHGGRGDLLALIDQTGVIGAAALRIDEEETEFDASPDSAYIRLEVHRATGGIRALSNARFL
jgi:predicted metal-dependent phosphoesterase TrpH